MKGENNRKRGQLKGYLFEIIIYELLKKNGFLEIDLAKEPKDRIIENREGFIEFKGRGCWHQIDCPFDYSKSIPFAYPIRLLGEVKCFSNNISKDHIREYIGVLKDIQENYFVTNINNIDELYPRKTEIGVYFSATDFQLEAEKLAYAHGIKTISYKNNFIVGNLIDALVELEEKYISVKLMSTPEWKTFKRNFINYLEYNDESIQFTDSFEMIFNNEILIRLRENLMAIRSSFIATTSTGVFLHFIGDSEFPIELFKGTDTAMCRVHYTNANQFYLTINGDDKHSKFYFNPPKTLSEAAIIGEGEAINEKRRHFGELNITIDDNGVTRNLLLKIDNYWLNLR